MRFKNLTKKNYDYQTSEINYIISHYRYYQHELMVFNYSCIDYILNYQLNNTVITQLLDSSNTIGMPLDQR